jgi:hypothetical protein
MINKGGTMSEQDVIPYATPAKFSPPNTVVVEPPQPWWIGCLLCVFVAGTSHFGLLELFGRGAAFTWTFAMLALGVTLGCVGLWKRRDQTALSLAGIGLCTLAIGAAVWLLMRG